MRGAIPPVPQYTFVAWCAVKAQRHLHLYEEEIKGNLKIFSIKKFNQTKLIEIRSKCKFSNIIYVFGRYSVRFSAGLPAILMEMFCSFPQSLYMDAGSGHT